MLDPNNSVLKRLWCNLNKHSESFQRVTDNFTCKFYYRSLNDAAEVYSHILFKVGAMAWLSSTRDPSLRIIDMYHSSCTPKDQLRVTKEFVKKDSVIRCVVATIAFGMGVDVSDIRFVVQWGPSKTALDFWQEIGRCARDGLRGEAVLYIIPRSLDPRKVDQSFATICKSAKCFRLLVLKELLIPGMSTEPLNALENRQSCDLNCSSCCCSLCLCCSNCKQSCKCFATAE